MNIGPTQSVDQFIRIDSIPCIIITNQCVLICLVNHILMDKVVSYLGLVQNFLSITISCAITDCI